MPRFAEIAALAGAVERLLLPAECLLCKHAVAPGDRDALVCGLCRSRWLRLPLPVCDRCGTPADPEEPCRLCLEWPAALVRVRSAVWLDESARRAVHALKYDGWWRVAEPIALAMRGLAAPADRLTLVPIPLGSRRLRRRGYNQSARIAAALAAVTGLPVAEEVLCRRRETPSQTRLTPEERTANVAGAFAAVGGLRGHFALVDDVFTTGATLAAAAAALEAAGAESVAGLTFARTRSAVG